MKTNLTRRELLKLSGLTLGTVVASNALAPVDAALGAFFIPRVPSGVTHLQAEK